MKIIAIEHEADGKIAADFQPYLSAEAAQVWRLNQAGVLREIYFRVDQTSAVLILECDDAAEAQAHLDTLPLVRAGLITFELIPLAPYPGYARLFEKQGGL
jgi:muconolactone delta-isomerase